MESNQGLHIEQRIGIRLSQQQLRFVRMLELNAPELDNLVEKELEDNPALEPEEETQHEPKDSTEEQRTPLYYTPSSGNDTPDWDFQPRTDNESLYEHLNIQISERSLKPAIDAAAKYIVGNLDSNGYLHRPLRNLIDDMAFGPGIEITEEEAGEALELIRNLEPYGVGAYNLQECLEIQLKHIEPSKVRDNALRIVTEAYEAFTMKHKHRIVSMLRISPAETDAALDLIRSLNPKPGSTFSSSVDDAANVIVPDFLISNEDGEITITLNNRIPELRIDKSFSEAMQSLERTPKGRPKKGSEFIVSRYNDARDFIKILKQRQETMMTVMSAIVKIQKEYFLTEDIYKLKPMMIKNIAAMTGLDISVISRATTNKFVATPWGIFPLRFFFSDSIGENTEGSDALTNRKIEAEIEALVNSEDKRHPLSDQKIMEEMVARGFEVSRRTVAKYRDRKGIPVARLRKHL